MPSGLRAVKSGTLAIEIQGSAGVLSMWVHVNFICMFFAVDTISLAKAGFSEKQEKRHDCTCKFLTHY